MHLDVVNFTGHENTCIINYYDHKGDYVRTYILDNLETELLINQRGNYSVLIKSSKCTFFDEFCKNGIEKIPKMHEIKKIEEAMAECIDWNEWELKSNQDIDDFMNND
jgi:hypothetical protein